MKYLTCALSLFLLTSAAAAHEVGQMHHHLAGPNWLPVLGGLLVIATAGILARVGK